MEEKALKKVFWSEAATGGLILGGFMFVLSFVSYYFNLALNYSTLLSVIQVAIIAGVMVFMGRKMSVSRGDLGFSYGESMSFVFATMIFTGIIYGIGEYFLQVCVDPDYFRQLYETALLKSNADQAKIEEAIKIRESIELIMKNPFVMVLSGVLSMLIYGGIVGFIVSAFIKKAPVVKNEE